MAFAADRADVDQGIAQFQRGAYEKALGTFRYVFDSEPLNTNVFSAISLFMIVKCDYELGNYDLVINDSRLFERTFKDTRYLADVMFERGKALAMKQQYFPAMLSAIRILSISQDDELKEDVMTFTSDISRYYLLPEDIEMLSSLVVGEESLTYLKLIWSERNIILGNYSMAEQLLQEVKSSLHAASFVNKYKELNKYLNKSRKNEDPEINIAVVLPLTGRYSDTGNQLLEGIKYAFESSRNKSKKRVNIIIVDTESNIRSGLNNLKQLLEMQNISAVIGPLTSDMAISMAPLCEYAGVPLIAPTATADDLTDMGNSIFQLNPEQQQRAITLANYATDILGYKRFAVVAPTTSYGIDISNAFIKSVEKNGAEVVYNVWYNDTPTNINDKMAELKDGAEYLPPYFNYLDGFHEARTSGYFEIDTTSLEIDSLETTLLDSMFLDSLVFDSLLVDSLYAISFEDTLSPPDTTFILEELWPDDPTIYEVLLFGNWFDTTRVPTDTLFARLKKHAKNWLSSDITIEEKYNTLITDSICILLDEQDNDPWKMEIIYLLSELDSIKIDSNFIGDYHFSRLVIDTVALEPYINHELIDSLKLTLAEMDSIDALWLLHETDTTLFPYIFPFENFGIEAIYFPVPQTHIQYIAPQWAKHRFPACLLGDGNWYQTNLLNRYKSNIDSMIIASDYYWNSKDINLRRFSKYFTQKTDKQPNRIHIYGYESMDLLMEIIENGGNSPSEISNKLKTLKGRHGIIRRIEFTPDHPRNSSGVRLISFFKGKLKPIN
ncbi:MAG: penicillin-binding protein activator [Candidatus Marinimicrobia bacterium]|nr:penicillin-binding protein activator [Candidatus Neomarinimicrobiota bacterium]